MTWFDCPVCKQVRKVRDEWDEDGTLVAETCWLCGTPVPKDEPHG